MRNIIIVECISTGTNFIEDIINRGYNPIVLEPKMIDTEEGEEYKKMVYDEYKRIKYDFDIIYEKDSYEETLEEVKKYDPLLVLPGNEKGVVLATKLSNDFQNFSSGEGKLICVARALFADPKILILDYPNYLSVSKLKRITEGKTAIILTPDETYIDFADKTINLDNL